MANEPVEHSDSDIRTCEYCAFAIRLCQDGTVCKSGSNCPFEGKLLDYLWYTKEPIYNENRYHEWSDKEI
jgi:hypothetical protein